MTTTEDSGPSVSPAGTADLADGSGGGLDWLDWAGIAALVLLLAIGADIWTDGKVISRWLPGKETRDAPQPDQPPGP